MWLDYSHKVFLSPPCLKAGVVEAELLDGDWDLSEMAEVRLRRQAGEKWRPDSQCNDAFGFWSRTSFWGKIFKQPNRWTSDGKWRW
jgi:hypothetical protein